MCEWDVWFSTRARTHTHTHAHTYRIKSMLKYDDVNVFLDTASWETFKTSAADSVPDDEIDEFLFKVIKEQLCCLTEVPSRRAIRPSTTIICGG